MRRLARTAHVATIALSAAAVPQPVAAQELASEIASAPDGWVRFSYDAREGVCGNGRWISFDGREITYDDGRAEYVCEEGPVRIELSIRNGLVDDLDTEVAGEWEDRSGTITDLGHQAPSNAVEYLFHLAETGREDIAEDAIFPATIARDVETWPRLLAIARGDGHGDVREQAVFWLGQEASERATEGLTSIIDDEDELEVREAAIFALSQRKEPRAFDALMSVARSSPEPELRRKAIFWLGQRGDDPRVLALLEEILTRGS